MCWISNAFISELRVWRTNIVFLRTLSQTHTHTNTDKYTHANTHAHTRHEHTHIHPDKHTRSCTIIRTHIKQDKHTDTHTHGYPLPMIHKRTNIRKHTKEIGSVITNLKRFHKVYWNFKCSPYIIQLMESVVQSWY